MRWHKARGWCAVNEPEAYIGSEWEQIGWIVVCIAAVSRFVFSDFSFSVIDRRWSVQICIFGFFFFCN